MACCARKTWKTPIKSLQALFLRTSGQATLLIKLIEVLRATRNVRQAFASIFTILTGISKGVIAVESKITLLRAKVHAEAEMSTKL